MGGIIQVPFFSGANATGTFLGQYFLFTGLGTSAGYGTGSNANFINNSATFAVPSNAESMYFALGAPNNSGVTGTLYLDNVSVTGLSPVPEPATLGLFALGGLGLLLLKRRKAV